MSHILHLVRVRAEDFQGAVYRAQQFCDECIECKSGPADYAGVYGAVMEDGTILPYDNYTVKMTDEEKRQVFSLARFESYLRTSLGYYSDVLRKLKDEIKNLPATCADGENRYGISLWEVYNLSRRLMNSIPDGHKIDLKTDLFNENSLGEIGVSEYISDEDKDFPLYYMFIDAHV